MKYRGENSWAINITKKFPSKINFFSGKEVEILEHILKNNIFMTLLSFYLDTVTAPIINNLISVVRQNLVAELDFSNFTCADDIKDNNYGEIVELFAAIGENTSIKKLRVERCGLFFTDTIYRAPDGTEQKLGMILADMIRVNKNIDQLNLRRTILSKSEMSAITAALLVNTTITHIDLRHSLARCTYDESAVIPVIQLFSRPRVANFVIGFCNFLEHFFPGKLPFVSGIKNNMKKKYPINKTIKFFDLRLNLISTNLATLHDTFKWFNPEKRRFLYWRQDKRQPKTGTIFL